MLNRHGYGFQYSVIRFIENLYKGQPDWELEATEFPVTIRNMQTRIDFIFRKRTPLVYLVGECKRVNPAFSNWCFANSPFARPNSGSDKVILQSAWVAPQFRTSATGMVPDINKRMLTGVLRPEAPKVYRVGLTVKSDQPGDRAGKITDAIEDAAGQVCKGLNGLIEFFHSQRQTMPDGTKLYFLPVIFTTARLWTTDTDLASANIDIGEFDAGSVTLKEADWIWYQYNISPVLKHTLSIDEAEYRNPFDLSTALELDFTRTIAIVSVNGIQDFLRQGFPYK